MIGGCNHYEWNDDTLYDRFGSMVVALMAKNYSLSDKIEKLMKVGEKEKLRKKV